MKKRKLVLALMLSLMMLVTMIPSFSFADETGTQVTMKAGSALKYQESNLVVAHGGTATLPDTVAVTAGGGDDKALSAGTDFDWVCGKLVQDGKNWSWQKTDFSSDKAGEFTYRMQLKNGLYYKDEDGNSSNDKDYISSDKYSLQQVRVIVQPEQELALNVTVTDPGKDGLKSAVQKALPEGKNFADITSLTIETASGASLYWSDDRQGRYADPLTENDAFTFLLDDCYNLKALDLSKAAMKASTKASYEYQGGTTQAPNGSTTTTYNSPTDGTWFPAEALYRERTRRLDGGINTGMKIMPTLKSLELPENTTVIGMKSCRMLSALENIKIPKSVTEISNMAFENTDDGTAAATIEFEAGSALKTLGNRAFMRLGTGSLKLPDSVESIGSNCFQACGFTDITLGTSLKEIGGGAFRENGNLTQIAFPESLTTIGGYAFYQTGLTKVTIPSTVTTIETRAFSTCANLEEVDLKDASADLTIGSQAFYSMPQGSKIYVKDVTMSNKVKRANAYKPANTTIINTSEFTDTQTGLIFDVSSGAAVVTGWNAPTSFDGNLTIPEKITNSYTGKTYSVTAIADGTNGTGAFQNKNELKSIELPSTLESIGDYAFYEVNSISELYIPKNVTKIGANAFSRGRDLPTDAGSSAQGLHKIVFEKSDKTVTIENRAFAKNGFLELVDAEDRPLSLEGSTFVGCGNRSTGGNGAQLRLNKASKIGPGTFMAAGNITSIMLNQDDLFIDQWAFLSADNGKTAYSSLRSGTVIYVDDDTTRKIIKDDSGKIGFSTSSGNAKVYPFILAVTKGGSFAKDTELKAGTLASPMKKGYVFAGWYNNANCTGKAVQKPRVNETYYAKWEKSAYSINGPLDLGELTYGETPQSGTFTVTAEKETNPSVTKVEGSDSFTAKVDEHDHMKVVVTPKENLSVGNYEETIVVTTGDGVMHDVTVKLVVKKRNSQTEDQGSVTTVTYGDKMNLSVKVGEAAAISTLSLDDEQEALNEVGFYYGDKLLGRAEVQYTDNGGTAAYEYDTTRGIIPTGSKQTVTAKYGGSDTLNGSQINIEVLINKADQAIAYGDKDVTKHINDGTFTNQLTQTTVHGKLTYKSSDKAVATVDATTGEVTIVGAGEATITATAEATDNYNEATDSYNLTVHQFSDKWSSNADGHWHACTVDGCDVKADSAAHEFRWVVDKEATTTEKGSKHEECKVCGYEKEAVEIPVIENGTTGGDQNNGNAGNGTKADAANGSKTGDTMPIGMLAVLMLAAAAGIAFCGRKLYKSR